MPILPTSNHREGDCDRYNLSRNKKIFEISKLGIIRSKQSKSSPNFCIQPNMYNSERGRFHPSFS